MRINTIPRGPQAASIKSPPPRTVGGWWRRAGVTGLGRTLALAALFQAWAPPALWAQQPLTLPEAVRMALESNPAIHAAEAATREADAGIRMAAAGRLPRVSYAESYSRSNNPVFVFGSLLNQRQFGPDNFEIERLNNPDSLHNFQSLLRVEQSLYDFDRTKHALRAARLRSDLTAEERRRRETDLVLGVVRAYFGTSLAEEKLRVATESVGTAASDLRRTQSMAESGMATQADVLSAQVHLAGVEEERIRAAGALAVSRAALGEVLGVRQSLEFQIVTPLDVSPGDPDRLDAYLSNLDQRPDLRQAEIAESLARRQTLSARSDLLPRVSFQGVLEADRRHFASDGGGNWLAGVSFQWDIWKGSEGRARVAARKHAQTKMEALRRQAAALAELELRRAFFDLSTAQERVRVSQASVEQARESHRIVENRYAAGLEGVTELIRSQEALMQAGFRHLSALHDQRVSRVVLEHAAGRLTPTSEVLQ